MAWVSTIGADMGQVEYRLDADAGCSLHADQDGPDARVAYRLDGAERPLEWVGAGLREVGIEPGSVLASGGPAGRDAALMLADGRDPRTGEVLVAAKLAVDPRAKLAAAPLVEAVQQAAVAAGVSPAELLPRPSERRCRSADPAYGVSTRLRAAWLLRKCRDVDVETDPGSTRAATRFARSDALAER